MAAVGGFPRPTAAPASASAPAFHVRARALRPVAARIISYGHEPRRPATLYVIRVAQSGDADWFVARRYSEFRALHDALGRQLARSGHACGACRELGGFLGRVRFPDRHRLQSRFGFSKKKLEAHRMDELNSYLRFLVGSTLGLLEDDEDDEDGGCCVVLRLLREFLMAGEFSEQRVELATTPELLAEAGDCDAPADASHRKRLASRRRLSRRGSSVESIPAHELALVAHESRSPDGADQHELSPLANPTFAGVFDDIALLPDDAYIHRQVPDHELGVNPLRRIEGFPRR